MKITRLYSGQDGESHFEDIDFPLNEKLGESMRSPYMKAKDIYFIECTGVHNSPWHTAPSRLLFVITRGELEIETGDGTKRKFVPDDCFIAEDTTGRGHLSRAKNRKAIIIRLAD